MQKVKIYFLETHDLEDNFSKKNGDETLLRFHAVPPSWIFESEEKLLSAFNKSPSRFLFRPEDERKIFCIECPLQNILSGITGTCISGKIINTKTFKNEKALLEYIKTVL